MSTDKFIERFISGHGTIAIVGRDKDGGEITELVVRESDLRALFAGKVLVPVEPTDEMTEAGYGTLPDCKCTEGDKWRAKLVYKAMITASQELTE